MTGTVEPNEDYRTAGQQLWRRLRRLGEEDGERQKYDGRNGWTWAGTYADAIRAEWPKLAAAGLTRARSQLPRWTARSVICLARRRGSGGESSWWIADEWEPAPSGMERKTGQVKKPRRKTTTAKVTRPPEPPAADFFQDPPPGALPEFIPRATRLGAEITEIKLSGGGVLYFGLDANLLQLDDEDARKVVELVAQARSLARRAREVELEGAVRDSVQEGEDLRDQISRELDHP